MIHQSPRSSSEYEPLMREWGAHFTCIAPDMPGFGHSEVLANRAPELDDYADAMVAFADAAGIKSILGYGFHSGGIVLVNAMKRHGAKFKALAIGGYAIWNEAERAKIGPPYIPPNPPKAFGEHLVWLWNRILEQSWYFPWFEPSDGNRMSVAHADVARIDTIIQDMLNSGDNYRLGYGAVLRGGRDIPPADAVTAPVRITAYKGDPLEAHLQRLGDMPAGWEAFGVETPKAHHEASLEFLLGHRPEGSAVIAEDDNRGFLPITTDAFNGLIHWRGKRGGRLHIHAPGAELDVENELAIDLPGHGLSSDWPGPAPTEWPEWQAVIDAAAAALGASAVVYPTPEKGDPEQLFPDLSPDRFGNYLTRAWAIARARRLFAPWYQASAGTAILINPADLDPHALAKSHRALIRAVAAKQYHLALLKRERD
jgi:haloalkane dehalogenase